MGKTSINTYISFKRVSRFPSTAAPIAMGQLNSSLPYVLAWDPDEDRHAFLFRTVTRAGEEIKVRVDLSTLVESLAAAEAAEADRWEPLVEDTDRPGVWGNEIVSAFAEPVGKPEDRILHIHYHRRDRAPIRDWRIGQRIKNQLAGPEWEAVEIYPAESRLVDSANEYHLWAVPWAFPFGFGEADLAKQDDIDVSSAPAAVQRDPVDVDTSSFSEKVPRTYRTPMYPGLIADVLGARDEQEG